MAGGNDKIEQQMTDAAAARAAHPHLHLLREMDLDRSAYGIMCRVADEGPQRLGSFASAFGLDPSTITRQVQASNAPAWPSGTPTPPTGGPRSWT